MLAFGSKSPYARPRHGKNRLPSIAVLAKPVKSEAARGRALTPERQDFAAIAENCLAALNKRDQLTLPLPLPDCTVFIRRTNSSSPSYSSQFWLSQIPKTKTVELCGVHWLNYWIFSHVSVLKVMLHGTFATPAKDYRDNIVSGGLAKQRYSILKSPGRQ